MIPRRSDLLGLLAAGLLLASGCATTPRPSIPHYDRFPLDPREELSGPFADEVLRGCAALAQGDAPAAEAAFSPLRSQNPPRLAAEIGWIEAVVMRKRPEDAVASCKRLLASGDPTVPLLVGCAEARAALGETPEALMLYRRALARDSGRERLNGRLGELRDEAQKSWLARARASARKSEWTRARAEVSEAISLAPDSSELRILAGDIETQAGEKAAALKRYREAMEMDPGNAVALEKTGALALDLEDHALAIAAFDRLASTDPRAARKAEDARLAFRVANWPATERDAARSPRLTRAGAAELVWWMVPEVREAFVGSGVIASDAVSRRDSRAVTRAVALGLLEVDNETHRVSPDSPLTLAAASKLLVRLLAILKPAPGRARCLGKTFRGGSLTGAEAVKLASACGLVSERDGPVVSGEAFLRAIDRARSLASENESS